MCVPTQVELVMTCLSKSSKQQHGAALMLLVFIIAIVMTTYLVKSFNSEALKAERKQQVARNLASAKDALMAWAVSNELHPGQFPYPDRLETTTPIYDGRGDCGGNPISNFSLLLGQLPIYGSDGCVSPVEGLGIDAGDGYGNRLWYAVSPNLVHIYSPSVDPVINPETMNSATWLEVRDRNGALVSNRVAAVIIAPGEAIGNQSRSNTATVDNFLDGFQIGANTYSNSDFDDIDEDFIIGDALEHVDDNDPTYTGQYLFNDQLVYITIDELMVALEKRVARDAIFRLREHFNNKGYFPYATLEGDNACGGSMELKGKLPLDACPVTANSLSLPSWFKDNDWDELLFYAVSSDCTESATVPRCTSGTLTVGSQPNVNALLITTGAPITPPQNRPNSFGDYLEGGNADAEFDDVFDAVGTPLTSNYNDQMFIVAP